MIETKQVSVRYENDVQALRDVTVRIDKGEFVFIVGPTGSGKSTFLKLINRELVPTAGEVIVAGRALTRMRNSMVPVLRRSVGVVFQDFRLLPYRTVWENVAFALHVIGVPGREIKRRVGASLELVNLTAKMDAFPHQLSGGEQQRASIARAIVNHPPILLADEPTGNLDPDTSWDIIKLLAKINLNGTTVVVASHDKFIVDRLKRRVLEFDAGKIVRDEEDGEYGVETAARMIPERRDWHLRTLTTASTHEGERDEL
jgi:cell division transport system ATP-binding protein